MEVAESEENSLNLVLFLVELVRLEGKAGSLHVLLKSLRRFVGKLNRSLKQTNGDVLTSIGRQEQSEGWVRSFLSVGIEPPFESDEEGRHQMDVLKHDPMAFLVGTVQEVKGNLILTRTKSDSLEKLLGVHSLLSAEVFDILYRVSTW